MMMTMVVKEPELKEMVVKETELKEMVVKGG
jgi:hypothetical protein